MFLAQARHLAQISHQSFDLAQISEFFNLALLQTWSGWEHPEWSFWTESTLKKKSFGCFYFKRWNGENLLVRGSGPGCGKGNSSQGIPETNLMNQRIEEFRGWVPAKGCSWRFPATLCRQVFLPHKSTRPFAVEDTLDSRCRLDFLKVIGTSSNLDIQYLSAFIPPLQCFSHVFVIFCFRDSGMSGWFAT